MRSAEGGITFSAPQVAGRGEPFGSELREHAMGRTGALEGLALEGLARGLSVRDIEDAFRAGDGRLVLSRAAVPERGARQLWREHRGFAARDLGEHELVHLLARGIAERVRPGQRREPAMAARGFTARGRRVLLHLMARVRGGRRDPQRFLPRQAPG